MTSVDDVQGYARKLKNQRERLENADIDERDRNAIRAFLRHEDTSGRVNTGTMVGHVNRLRLSAEIADAPLVEMHRDDVDGLLFALKHDRDLAPGTIRNYRKALRVFFRWREEPWFETIDIGPSPDRSVDPNELLDEDEVDRLLAAAWEARDKAALALLADTGLRIGAVASLRVRDVDLGDTLATVSVNEAANVKGATGPVPLTWSRGHVANWLDVHPRSDETDVALIHKLRMYADDDGALSQQYLGRRLKGIARVADIDPDRVHGHAFRKLAITTWIREGLSEQEIKHRAHWVKDSSQFEVYSGVTDAELNEQIAAHYGIVADEAARPDLEVCPQCATPLRPSARFCPGCGAPLTAGAASASESIEDDVVETVAEDLSRDDIEQVLAFRETLKKHPELRTFLLSD